MIIDGITITELDPLVLTIEQQPALELNVSQNTSINLVLSGAVGLQGPAGSFMQGTPASSSAAGTAGTVLFDAGYIYVCTAANTWRRAAISTW